MEGDGSAPGFVENPRIKPIFDVFFSATKRKEANFYSPGISFRVAVENEFNFERAVLLADGSNSLEDISKELGLSFGRTEDFFSFLSVRNALEEKTDVSLLKKKLACFVKKQEMISGRELVVVSHSKAMDLIKWFFTSLGFERVCFVAVDKGDFLESVKKKCDSGKNLFFVFLLNSTYFFDCKKLNKELVLSGIPSVYSFFDGVVCSVPFPKKTCFECFLLSLEELRGGKPGKHVLCPGKRAWFEGENELVEWLLKKTAEVIDSVLVEKKCAPLVFFFGDNKAHPLLKRGRCSACSVKIVPSLKPPKSAFLKLESRKYAFRENGARVVSPKKTLEKAKSITGRLGPILSVRRTSRVLSHSFSSDPLDPGLKRMLSQVSLSRMTVHCGKGVSEEQAMASAVMEAVERYCGKFQGFEPELRASFAQVKDFAINPLDFFIGRREFRDFDCEQEINWTWGYSFSLSKPVLIPSVLVYLAYLNIKNSDFLHYDSNGLASGNCLEEALLHGLLEVLERDANYIVLMNGLRMPDIELDSFNDPLIGKALSIIEAMGIKLHLKDYSNDLKIPAIAAFLEGTNKENGDTMFSVSVGLDLSPETALLRALTEALSIYPKGNSVSVLGQARNLWSKTEKSIKFSSMESLATGDLKLDFLYCVDLLKSQGYETFAVDLSKSGIPFSVVRVLVSGIQPVTLPAFQRISKRMFSVPKKLGFSPKPKPSDLSGFFDVYWRVSPAR